jgi:hypothetical protein
MQCIQTNKLTGTIISSGVPRGVYGVQTLPPPQKKIRSFDKGKLYSQFCGKYFYDNLIRIQVSLFCKFSGTPDYGATTPRFPFSLLSVLNWICWTPHPEKFLGMPLMIRAICDGLIKTTTLELLRSHYNTIGTDWPVLVYCQSAHYLTPHGGCVIRDSYISNLLHVIILANLKCAYTISLAINITTDSNNMCLVSWWSVSSIRLSITKYYWLIATHKTYWIPSHLHKILNPQHIITNTKLLFHDSKFSLTKSITFSACIPVR